MASELVTPVEVGATQFAAASLRAFFFLRAAESRLLSSSLLLSLLTRPFSFKRVCIVWGRAQVKSAETRRCVRVGSGLDYYCITLIYFPIQVKNIRGPIPAGLIKAQFDSVFVCVWLTMLPRIESGQRCAQPGPRRPALTFCFFNYLSRR